MSVAGVFAALADDTRRELYEQLLDRLSGLTATELSQDAAVSRQAIVRHLQILERSGLASSRRDGREVRYFADANGTVPASNWLASRTATWNQRLAKLEERTGGLARP